MITITAMGFIGDKPQLQVISADSQKVEFDVISARRHFSAGEWKTAWERVTFVAWGEEAERIATSLDKGNEVSCTGLQETSEWIDRSTQAKRYRVRYRLTAWVKQYRAPARQGAEAAPASQTPQAGQSQRRDMRASTPAPAHQRSREDGGEYYDDGESRMNQAPRPPAARANVSAARGDRSAEFIDM